MNRLGREELGNFDEYIERLNQCKLLNEQEVKQLCDKAKEVSLVPNRYSLSSPM